MGANGSEAAASLFSETVSLKHLEHMPLVLGLPKKPQPLAQGWGPADVLALLSALAMVHEEQACWVQVVSSVRVHVRALTGGRIWVARRTHGWRG